MAAKISLAPLQHRGAVHIAVRFDPNRELEQKIRTVPAIKWSQTHRCWYLPLTPGAYLALKAALPGETEVDETALRKFGEQRKQVAATLPEKARPAWQRLPTATPAWHLGTENLSALQRFVQELHLKVCSSLLFAHLKVDMNS